MAAPKVVLGWDNSQLHAGAAKAQGIVAGFASRTRATLGNALNTNVGGALGSFSAAVGSLAGLKSVIDGFDRILDLSLQLDTSVESLQRHWQHRSMANAERSSICVLWCAICG